MEKSLTLRAEELAPEKERYLNEKEKCVHRKREHGAQLQLFNALIYNLPILLSDIPAAMEV